MWRNRPLRSEKAGIIKDGYSEEADQYCARPRPRGRHWLAESGGRGDGKRQGSRPLKVKFNKVFGYYFEVTNSFKDQVPDYFIRKQTLTNAERYTTDRLKELEDDDHGGGGQAVYPGI